MRQWLDNLRVRHPAAGAAPGGVIMKTGYPPATEVLDPGEPPERAFLKSITDFPNVITRTHCDPLYFFWLMEEQLKEPDSADRREGGLRWGAEAGQLVFLSGVLNFIFADRAVGVEWESNPFLRRLQCVAIKVWFHLPPVAASRRLLG